MKKHSKIQKLKPITEKDYFDEAKSWDSSLILKERYQSKLAWTAFLVVSIVAISEAVAIIAMMPLKTIENSIVRVNEVTGETSVVSNLKEMDEDTEQVMRRYWLAQYIKDREGYNWNTREHDREMVGIMSSPTVQEQYAKYTDADNPNAPINLYGDNVEVDVKVNPAITYLDNPTTNPGQGELDNNGERVYTALVRYSATVKRLGQSPITTYWTATISFVYTREIISVNDRLINPVGFQVISYRKDPEGEAK